MYLRERHRLTLTSNEVSSMLIKSLNILSNPSQILDAGQLVTSFVFGKIVWLFDFWIWFLFRIKSQVIKKNEKRRIEKYLLIGYLEKLLRKTAFERIETFAPSVKLADGNFETSWASDAGFITEWYKQKLHNHFKGNTKTWSPYRTLRFKCLSGFIKSFFLRIS